MHNNTKMTGRVKWFNDAKGFGFIILDINESDVFVHYSEILDTDGGRKTLLEGQKVEFEIKEAEKGKIASNVTRI